MSGESAVLRFDDVSLYFGDTPALVHVSFEMGAGETRVVLGASGSGKTMLLKTALGLVKPDSGRIYLFGQDISGLKESDLFDIRSKVGVLDARFDENKFWIPTRRLDIALLHPARVIVGERVDADDIGPILEQTLGKRRSDETGDARDQRLHKKIPRTRCGSRRGRPSGLSDACTVRPVAISTTSDGRTTS